MKMKKIFIFLTAVWCVALTNITACAAKPDIISKESLEEQMQQAEETLDGNIVRIDVPDENGNYITLEGEAAEKWWEEAGEKEEQYLEEDMAIVSENEKISAQINPKGMFTYKYRYIESSRTKNVKRKSLKKNVTNQLTNYTSTKQQYDLTLSVSQSWTINSEVSGKYKSVVLSKLGSSWGKTYSREETLHVNIAPGKTVQVQFIPIMDRSKGKVQKYYIPRGSSSKKAIVEKTISVTTYNPKYTTCKVGAFKIKTVYGVYIWVEK